MKLNVIQRKSTKIKEIQGNSVKINEILRNSKKSKKFFFWNRKKNNKASPVEKNLDSSQYGTTDPSTWDLSEETLERELRELKKQKQNS